MNIRLIKFMDLFIGSALCLILGLYDGLCSVFRKRNVKTDRILIVRLWAIGETILTLPMIKALKKAFPDSKITVLTTPAVSTIFECTDLVDEILMWSPGVMFRYFNKFDIAIDTEPYLRISSISSYFMAKERIGFSNQIRSLLYTIKVHFNDMQHEVLTFMDLAKTIGIDHEPAELVKLKTGDEERKAVEQYLDKYNAKHPIIGICAGSAESAAIARRWMPERYASVTDHLISKYNATVLFTGTKKERVYIDRIIDSVKGKNVINAAGKTSIKQIICLIGMCDIFISNDTGSMHIAAAQGVRTIGLFGPNLPQRFRPYGEKNIALYMKMPCSPCINVHKGRIKNCKNPVCLELISKKAVIDAADSLLEAKQNQTKV